MVCVVCPAVGWAGGWIGGYLGINPPPSTRGKIVSALITASLITLTVIALKNLFNVTLCEGGGFTLRNIAQVGIQTLVMGIIYSIGVNFLLNRYVFYSQDQVCQPVSNANLPATEGACPPCCCKKKS